MKESMKWGILLSVTLMTALVVVFAPRVSQWPAYHHFADQRMAWGMPHFMDVASNIPFLLVGFLGFRELRRQWTGGLLRDRQEMLPYLFFFIGVFLTGIGSAYYHWAPNNARLVWDRIPMTVIIMSLVSIILMEKAGAKIGAWSLPSLLLIGVSSVIYWIGTESLGRGDLRPYGFILFYPVILIPLILFLFPKPFPAANELVRAVVYYALAKAFEAKDGVVYAVTGVVSGHTLKHLLAAFSVFWVVRMLQKRGVAENPLWSEGKFPKTSLTLYGSLILGVILILRSVIAMPGDAHRFKGFIKRAIPPEEAALRVRLEQHIKVLAVEIGIRHCGNPEAYQKLGKSAGYISGVWRSQGYQVEEQEYEVEGHKVKNLFVEKKGTDHPDEILVVGAHYDGVQDGPAANDNGSGVAALLELSGSLAKQPVSRTVQFVAFVNEEPPFFQTGAMGSRVYAGQMGMEKKNVVGMISLETIGCYLYEENTQKYPWPFSLFYPDTGSFIAFVGNYASRNWVRQCVKTFRQESAFPSEGVAAPEFIQGIGWSDHWSFWQEGYPALMVTDTAPFRYKYYHTPEDTPDKINFPQMAWMIAGLQKTILRLAQ